MPFEVYTREFVRSTEPRVTITNLGRFSVSNGAVELLKKHGTTDTVLLFWDRATSRIGIQGTKKGDRRSYTMKASGPNGRSGTGFSAVTFLNHINYDWSKSHSFFAEWSEKENMLTFVVPSELLAGKPGKDGKHRFPRA